MSVVHAATERTPFVGRARERGLILAEITAGTRLLTLVGPSGIGKTRLARDALRSAYPHPAAFCSALGCSTASDLQAAVARALGITLRAGDRLERILADRGPLLLALDNLDDLDESAAGVIAAWLARAPALQLLGTSIVPLGIEEEACFEVGPLDPADAVALYLERAHRAWADRAFSDVDRRAIEELVGRLDRIPLAIELAAARVRVLPPQAMLPRLDQRFELLDTQRPGRHGSLLRALQVTWDLLSPAEQETLARASVFEGSFTLEAAAAVMEADAGELLDRLDGLRAKALLQIEGEAEPRFSLYESVRAFASRQLGDAEAVARRHATFFLAEGARHAERTDGPEAPASLRWLKAERENLVAILRRRADGHPLDAARAGLALSPILALDGPPASEAELLDATVRSARAAGDPELLVRALRSRGVAILQHGRSDDALADIEEGLSLARQHRLRRQEGLLLIDAGIVHLRRGAIDRALGCIEGATAIGEGLGDTEVLALAWLYRGSVERSRDSTERALESFERAHALLRRHGHLRREAAALLNIAVIHSALGRFAEGVRALDQVIEIGRRLESRVFEANAIVNRGGIHLAAGDLDAATADSRHALELQRALGSKRFEALALANLGIADLERNELAAADEQMGQAMAILRASDERQILACLLPFAAISAARQGRHEEARRLIAEMEALRAAAIDAHGHVMAELAEGCLELASAADEAAHAAAIRSARARLERAAAVAGGTVDCVFSGIRLLRQDLARHERMAEAPAPALAVGPGGAWFQLGGGERIDLRRRGSLRRMLDGLVERRLAAPGSCLETSALFELGWPDERIRPEAQIARVYTGIWTLRSLGLSTAIRRHSEGYLLDPDLPVTRVPA